MPNLAEHDTLFSTFNDFPPTIYNLPPALIAILLTVALYVPAVLLPLIPSIFIS